ncbi:MAG: HNH endonuclease [Methylophilaceae bacterium]
MDRLIWAELGQDEKKVLRLAESIREGAQTLEGIQEEIDDDLEFAEGKAVTRLHNIRERNPRLRKKLLAYRKQKDTMYCDICSTSYVSSNESIQDAMFEAHHVAPLATRESKITKLSDMALLCANCHRLLHRAISVEKRWFSLKEAKELIYPL